MARFDFCGGSATVQSIIADAQRTVNMYPEINESGDGRSKMILLGIPGIVSIAKLSGSPRGQLEYNGRLFVVAGTNLYEITLTSSSGITPIVIGSTVLGTVANDGLPASLAASENQLMVASSGNVYVYYIAATVDSVSGLTIPIGAFNQVNPANFTLSTGLAPVIQVAFCDSFFLALIKNSQTIGISNVLDGNNWNFNGQIVVNVYPENVVGMIVDHREVWLRGNKKSVVYYASGSLNVFDVQPGGFIEEGGVAPFGASQLDNSIFWLGGDERGDSIAWRNNGYTPIRVSTHAEELAWQGYPKRSDAVSYTYQQQGHSFWVILFPSANNGNGATWVFDVASGLWHERDNLNVTTGQRGAHPSWNHAFWKGVHIVGAWQSNDLYQMDFLFMDNNGTPITRLRRATHIATELETIAHSRFILDMETGLGPIPPLQGGGVPTVFTLQDSNGIKWGLTVLGNGNLQTTSGSTGATQTIFLNVGAATWQVGVTITGLLTTTSVAFAANPQFITLVATDSSTAWDLAVTSIGLLTTTQNFQTLARGPLVWLRWSDDGGHTWSSLQPRDAGQAAVFKPRIVWRRLGRARIRTYEVSCSEPIPVRFIDAYINAVPGYQPSERLTRQYQKVA